MTERRSYRTDANYSVSHSGYALDNSAPHRNPARVTHLDWKRAAKLHPAAKV